MSYLGDFFPTTSIAIITATSGGIPTARVSQILVEVISSEPPDSQCMMFLCFKDKKMK